MKALTMWIILGLATFLDAKPIRSNGCANSLVTYDAAKNSMMNDEYWEPCNRMANGTFLLYKHLPPSYHDSVKDICYTIQQYLNATCDYQLPPTIKSLNISVKGDVCPPMAKLAGRSLGSIPCDPTQKEICDVARRVLTGFATESTGQPAKNYCQELCYLPTDDVSPLCLRLYGVLNITSQLTNDGKSMQQVNQLDQLTALGENISNHIETQTSVIKKSDPVIGDTTEQLVKDNIKAESNMIQSSPADRPHVAEIVPKTKLIEDEIANYPKTEESSVAIQAPSIRGKPTSPISDQHQKDETEGSKAEKGTIIDNIPSDETPDIQEELINDGDDKDQTLIPDRVDKPEVVQEEQEGEIDIEDSKTKQTLDQPSDDQIKKTNDPANTPFIGSDDAKDSPNEQLVNPMPNDAADEPPTGFLSYFFALTVVAIVAYCLCHNKRKLCALVLEGRDGRNSKRRRGDRNQSAKYHKLDNNLEEAVTSNSNASFSQVVY